MDRENKKTESYVYIGMGGWEIPPFNGIFYPSKPEKGFRKLEYYSRFFDLVEVNATFYNTSLSPRQAQQWLKDVGENKRFIFTVKLFRGFSHTFNATKSDVLAVHRLLDPLRTENKLGGLVIQFPSSFIESASRQSYLIKLRSIFTEDKLFLDLRHNSWNIESFYKFCHDNGFNLINVDLPKLPGHMPLNSFAWEGTAYFRLMGRNAQAWEKPGNVDRYLYKYSDEELEELVRLIKQVSAIKKYVVFHNDRQAFSIVNGRQVEHGLDPAKRFLAPAKLINTFPQLKPFCEPLETDGCLFTAL